MLKIFLRTMILFYNSAFVILYFVEKYIFIYKYVLIHTCSKTFSLKKKFGIDVHGYKEVVMTFLYPGFDFCVIKLITIRVTVCKSYVTIFGFCYNCYNKPTS